jgi:tetratricopeptide (TPR) repeat protein
MSAAIVLLSTFAIIPVTNFDLEREDLFATRVFLMPAYVLMGVGLAVTLAWASRSLAGCPRMTYSAALAVCPAIFVIATYADHDRSDYFWIEDYGRAILKPLPKDTVLIPSGDVSTFPLLYLQAVEGFRKDIHLIDRAGTLEREEAVRFLPDEVVAQIHDAPRDVWVTALLSHGTRPVATLNKTGLPQAWVLEPCGMAFLSVRAEDKGSRDTLRGSQAVFMRDLVLRNEETPTVDDYSADVARAHIEQVRAREALAAGNPPRAMEHLEQALAFGKGIKELANNIGALLAENDLKERAAAAFQAALRIRPDYRMARRNLMITLAALGQHAENLAVGEVGLRFHPKDDVLFEESIRSAKALKDGDALRGLCAARAAALPHDPKPDRALADWEMEQGNKIKAQLHLARAAQKAPLDEDGRRLLAELEADLGLPPTVMGGASEASSQGSSPTDTLERLMAKDLLAGAGPGPGRPAMGTPTQTYTPIPGVQDISALGTTVNDPRMTSDLRPHLGTAEQVSNPLGATQIAPSGRSTER